jgi:peptidoglycan hydrolase-like protein with peptidoglycan-binding domain
LASTNAHKQSKLPCAAAAALALGLLGLAPAATLSASPGGTAPTGGPTAVHKPAGAKGATGVTGGAPPLAPASRILSVSCVPAAHCSTNAHQVSSNGTLLIQGAGLKAGMIVVFPRTFGARVSRNSPGSPLRRSPSGLIVALPRGAHSGRIMVLISRTRTTAAYGPISVVHGALHPPVPKPPPPPVKPVEPVAPGGSGLEGQGMWIWYMNQSNGGSVSSIVARAHAAGVSTLFIKSSDGSQNYWSQFSSKLVAELHANGLKACAWQYVYGTNPTGEAALGAEAVASGADCLVIDAEAEYEGHYSAAQTYLTKLRAKIGAAYPLALTSFPEISYHESFPYSVFLGPGGAQFNLPQMYWHDIGISVDTMYANTYIANRIYSRPIFPLGQTYGGVSTSELLRFREEAPLYGAKGLSFWDWQETPSALWKTLAAPLAALGGVVPNTSYPEFANGSSGDQVLWMQEHLARAVPAQATTGNFDSKTAANLRAFQTAHGIPASGVTNAATWAALMALPPVAVSWTGGGPSG